MTLESRLTLQTALQVHDTVTPVRVEADSRWTLRGSRLHLDGVLTTYYVVEDEDDQPLEYSKVSRVRAVGCPLTLSVDVLDAEQLDYDELAIDDELYGYDLPYRESDVVL